MAAKGSANTSTGYICGYDCQFVRPPQELEAECPICLLVIRNAHITSCCGRNFCKSCVQRSQLQTGCSLCNGSGFTIVYNRALDAKLKEFDVYCTHKKSSCGWVGRLEHLDTHLNPQEKGREKVACKYGEVSCAHDGCLERFQRRLAAEHGAVCPKRPFRCEHCDAYASTYEDVVSSHWSACDKFPVPCPNGCEVGSVERCGLQHHVDEECPATVVDCEFSFAGCKERLPRKDMPDHLLKNTGAHLSLLAVCFHQRTQRSEEEIKKLSLKVEHGNEKISKLEQDKDEQTQRDSEEIAALTKTVSGLRELVSVMTPRVQRMELQVLLHKTLKKDDTWFLVDMQWMKQWKKYVGYDQWDQESAGLASANPGPVDNSNLFKDKNCETLKDHLMEELDYILLPQAAWHKLVVWYGLSKGSRPIPRQVVEYGFYIKHLKVEVYLLVFSVYEQSKGPGSPHTLQFSKAITVSDMEARLREVLAVPEGRRCRLWHRYMTNTYELLEKPQQTLQDVGLFTGQTIVLEQQCEDGTWLCSTASNKSVDDITNTSGSGVTTRSSSSASYGGGSYWSSYKCSQQPTTPGLCGLSNLGKTCFMNSALQCLSSTRPLTEYFVPSQAGYKPYKKHINKTNPLGMGGAIAEAYGYLLECLWSGKYSSFSPKEFKMQVGRYAPKFEGSAQHDSQELLAFLLDGLHEDLNLVQCKPDVDMAIKTKDRTDHDIAEESWYKYLLRNQSVIVKLFQGQLKSSLICPRCNTLSKKFDPFTILSLPLPYKKVRTLQVYLVRCDPASPVVKYKLMVSKRGCVADLKNELQNLTDVDPQLMAVVDVHGSRFYRIYDNCESLSHILDRDDIYIYELQALPTDSVVTHVPVYHREHIQVGRYSYEYCKLFGLPLVVALPRASCTYRNLYKAIVLQCRRIIRQPEGKAATEQEQGSEAMEEEDSNGENTEQDAADTSEHQEKEGDGGKDEKEKDGGKDDLFELVVVNSYGSQEVSRLKDNDKLLSLNRDTYIACEWQTSKKERFYDMEAAESYEVDSSMQDQGKGAHKKNIDLLDCMRLFTDQEKLGVDDAWFCPHCKDKVQATRKFDLWNLPQVLVIHLKRFSNDCKLDVLVDFPFSGLDLSDFLLNPDHPQPIYDLYAVSNHFESTGGGHYTAFTKHIGGGWYNFDDSHVSKVSEDRVMSSAAYLLFYQRRMM